MGFWADVFGFSKRDNNVNNKNLFNEVFGVAKNNVSPNDALGIPIVNACISRISDIVASTDVKLYRKTDKGIKQVIDDNRVKLLNTKIDNGTLNGFEFRKVIVRDYFLKGDSYFYIKRKGNDVIDLVYLDNVSVSTNQDRLNKLYSIFFDGKVLRPYQILRFTRNSDNGVTGKSIVEESGLQFLVILKTMERMLMDVKRGFLPKGFFKLERNIGDLSKVTEDIKKILSDENAGYMIFNKGVEFESLEKKKDVEKEAKANTSEINRIASLFGVPVPIISGGANEEDKFNFVNFTILPLLANIEASLNRDLLTEKEQGEYYFAFETKELLKGNIYERFKAYEVAIKNNIMSMDEVRDFENMERLNFGFYKMNIADAFYYPDKNVLVNVNSSVALDLDNVEITNNIADFNGNFGAKSQSNELKGGESDGDKSL